MDGETGKDVVHLFAVEHSHVPVLYMSGYNNEVIAERGVILDGTEYLKKPFNLQDLLTKVDNILAHSQTAGDIDAQTLS